MKWKKGIQKGKTYYASCNGTALILNFRLTKESWHHRAEYTKRRKMFWQSIGPAEVNRLCTYTKIILYITLCYSDVVRKISTMNYVGVAVNHQSLLSRLRALTSWLGSSHVPADSSPPKRRSPAFEFPRPSLSTMACSADVRFFVRIIACSVVTTDHRPAGIVGSVLVRTMQQVGVKEKSIARFHFDVDQLQLLENFIHSGSIGAGLLAGQKVFDSSQFMGAFDDLHATILARGRIDRDVHAGQQRKQHPIVIPVAIVLVPAMRRQPLGLS